MEQVLSLLGQPLVWLLSGIMSVAWSVLGNLVTPKVRKILASRGQSKLSRSYLKLKERWQETKTLERNSVERYEQKLDGIQLQLMGIAFYLLSFFPFWLASIFEPPWMFVFMGVSMFILGTGAIDKGIKMSFQARLAHQREKEIKKIKSENDETDREALLKNIDDLNERDFGFRFETEYFSNK